MDDVIWHDVECGAYAADLPLWRALAAEAGGPVLDLGAGTGRVALDLARAGHEVHALDLEPVLLDALAERGRGLDVHRHVGDARDFALGRRFALVLAPMQTVQLLGGPAGRAAMLARVREHLAPGGLFAAAVAAEVEPFDGADWAPLPDVREIGGIVFSSRAVAIREEPGAHVLERLRERVDEAGGLHVSHDAVRLDRLTAADLEAELRAAGLAVEERRVIAPTDDHVGSEVVLARG